MKKIIFLLTSALFCSPVLASTLSDQIHSIESALDFSEKTLYTYIQDRDLTQQVSTVCSEHAVKSANLLYTNVANTIQKSYIDMSDAQVLINTLAIRDRLHSMHAHLDDTNADGFCARKLLLYRLQALLRKYHIALLDKYDVLGDFMQDDPAFTGGELKKTVVQQLIDFFPDTAYEIRGTVENPDFLKQLPKDQQQLAILNRRLVEKIIQQVLAQFLRLGLFTLDDLDQIRRHVFFEYVSECTTFHGSYEVRQTFSGRTSKITNTETLGLHIKLSTCGRMYVVLQLPEIYRDLLYHELGHHVWRYKDLDSSRFTNFCRTADGERTQRCTAQDFVSEYAQTLPEEDYADTFQQWILHHTFTSSIIASKLEYFDKLFAK